MKSRVSTGFVAAWVASLAATFIAGCFYSVLMESGHVEGFLKGIATGNKDALSVFLLVGYVAAVAASVVSALAIVFIAWPLYRASKRHGRVSLRAYLGGGLAISTVVAGILLPLQHYLAPMVSTDYWFEFLVIFLGGGVAVVIFWLIVRPDRVGGSAEFVAH